jgi:trimeric autotransporter adhesin
MSTRKESSYRLPFLVALVSVLSLFSLTGIARAAQDTSQSTSSPASRIVDRIDESQLVTLKGTMHPLANARNDRGAAPESMQLDRMHLVLTRSATQDSSLRQLISDLHTPGTASYHKWLTPDQFGKQFGPSDQDITTVETWLTGHGFSVTKVNPGKQTIEFSGNVTQMRSAFHTQIHKYEVNGETHYANANDPQIPAALAPVVGGFVALNNFHAKSYAKNLGKASYDPKTDQAKPQWTTGSSNSLSFVLSPADYAVQYDLNPLYTAGTNGAGQSIAIVNESNINIYLVNQFRSLFGLPANPPQVIIDGNDPGIDGINNPDGPNGASIEAYLDVEWSGAVAPQATIDLVIAGDTALEGGLFLAAEHAVYGNIAPVISLSFGNCEANLGSTNAFLNGLWEQAAAQGITVMVSTGDDGSAGCDNDDVQEYAINGQAVSGFASTPYNVAVGGTDFYYNAYSQGLSALIAQLPTYWNETPSNSTPAVSIKGIIPEQPWNSSQYGLTLSTLEAGTAPSSTSIAAGSGGSSSLYTTKPAWQKGFGNTVRDIPDLSLFASSGANASFYPECFQDGDCQPVSSGGTVQITGVGGTSASAPAFAGIMALVNQKYGRQGQADFVLYPLATQFPAAFNDVKNGTNSVPCNIDVTSEGEAISPDCIAVSNPITVTDPNLGEATEGEIGTGTTAEYNAVAGYDLASGLGTVDAATLVDDWNKVTFTKTTTTLTPSETSFAHGTAITISGAVAGTGTPTGDVALVTASTEPGQQGQTFFTLSGGAYSGSVSTLPGGTYNIWGQYGGDSTNSASSSTPVQVTVAAEASKLNFNIYSPLGTYTSSSTPGTSVDYGTQLILSGQPVSSASSSATTTPTGAVTFTDGSTVLNTAVLNAEGDAEYNAPFSVGAHSVTAKYSGDQSYNASTASAIAFTVVKDSPTIYLGASNLISNNSFTLIGGQNQPTVLNVLVENTAISSTAANSGFFSPVPVAAPTGTVTLSGSGLPSGFAGTQTLKSSVDSSTQAPTGVATFTIPASTSGGTYNITISYAGDTNYASTSVSGSIQVQTSTGLVSDTTATLTGSISPATNITVSGTVTGQSGHPAPTGSVYIYTSGNAPAGAGLVSGSSDVSSYSFVLNSQNLVQGANLITIQYTGDTVYLPSAVQITNPSSISNPLSDFTLVPQSAIVAVSAPGGSGTVPVNITSVNGFTGSVALRIASSTNPGIGIQIPASVTLAANGSQTANLVLTPAVSLGSGTFNVELIGTDSTGKYVHTAGLQLVVGGSVAATPSFSLAATPPTLSLAQGASGTSAVTVTPIAGLTGAIGLTCAVTGPSGATSPATCTLPSSVTISGTAAQTATLNVATTSTTTAGAYTVTVTGTQGTITQTTAVTVTVTASVPASFTLTNSGNISVSPGATTGNTSTITINPTGGFSGTVSLTCAVTASPSGATDSPTCLLNPASATTTSTLTVATTGTSADLSRPKNLFWPSAGGAVLALLVFFGIPARKRNWPALLGLLILFVAAGAIGCGGGGSSSGGGGGGGGTTAGSYTVTVTGTSGAITQTTAVTLTVQ